MLINSSDSSTCLIGWYGLLIWSLVSDVWVVTSVSSRFAETRFAEIMVRGWCPSDSLKPDSPKPVSPKPDSPKLGFRVRV